MKPLSRPFAPIAMSLVVASLMATRNAKLHARETPPSRGEAVVSATPDGGVDLSGKGKYRRFWNAISPDGKYTLGWGLPGIGSRLYAEIPEKSKELFSSRQLDGDGPVNFLVDANRGSMLATIPAFHFYEGPEGSQGRHRLLIGWSPDSRAAVAIDRAQWSNGDDCEEIAYIDPVRRRCYPILDQMSAALRRVLPDKPKAADQQLSPFFDPVMVDSRTLVVDASNYRDLEHPHYDYRFQFRIEIKGEVAIVQLTKSRAVTDEEADPGRIDSGISIEETEDVLQKSYARLRAKLGPKGRELLQQSQSRWLRFRQSVGGDTQELTRIRIRELVVRGSEWGK
jgi:hypothetical protein